MKTLPEKLRAWRHARKLSQSQAAPVLGVTLGTLRRWEQGRHEPQGLGLAALLGIMEDGNGLVAACEQAIRRLETLNTGGMSEPDPTVAKLRAAIKANKAKS